MTNAVHENLYFTVAVFISCINTWGAIPQARGRSHRPLAWSGRRDSNPLPTAWEAVALPGELLPHRTPKLYFGFAAKCNFAVTIYETDFGNETSCSPKLYFGHQFGKYASNQRFEVLRN